MNAHSRVDRSSCLDRLSGPSHVLKQQGTSDWLKNCLKKNMFIHFPPVSLNFFSFTIFYVFLLVSHLDSLDHKTP